MSCGAPGAMTDNQGFKAFEKRIEELLKTSSCIPPGEVLNLLKKADGNPRLDVEKEMALLRKKYSGEKE